MATGKPIYVVLDSDGQPVAATPFVESAQNFVASDKSATFVKVPRLTAHSAVSLEKRESVITERIVDMAISAKLQGTSLSKFAKARGVRYEELRDRVNAKWGYSKPWPTGKPGKKANGGSPTKWTNHRAIFEAKPRDD